MYVQKKMKYIVMLVLIIVTKRHNQYDPKPRRTSGQCIHKITTEEGCKAAAMHNKKTNVDNNNGYGNAFSSSYYPPGCYQQKQKILF